jgi:hypothetical protein
MIGMPPPMSPAVLGPSRVPVILMRGLGFVWLLALLPLYSQGPVLFGADGLQPAHEFLECTASHDGWAAFVSAPSLLWLSDSNLFIGALTTVGVLAAAAMLAGQSSVLLNALPWFVFLSFVTPGGDGMQYIWDQLLLETGALSLLIPRSLIRPVRVDGARALWVTPWWRRALLFLNFKLWFSMGIVKLLGDPAWWSLDYMKGFLISQPMPAAFAWWLDKLPWPVLAAATAAVLLVEVIFPFFLLTRVPTLRKATFIAFVGLQVAIQFVGNYAYFNILTALIALAVLDDPRVLATLPPRAARWLTGAGAEPRSPTDRERIEHGVRTVLPLAQSAMSLVGLLAMLIPGGLQPLNFHNYNWLVGGDTPLVFRIVRPVARVLADFRVVNPYGVFGETLPPRRPELIIEASADAVHWAAYVPRFRPVSPQWAPGTYAPFFPRFEQQLYYEAVGAPFYLFRRLSPCMDDKNAFGRRVVRRLFDGDRWVEGQYRELPPAVRDHVPPGYLRVLRYLYRFTTLSEWFETGDWLHAEFEEEVVRVSRLRTSAWLDGPLVTLPGLRQELCELQGQDVCVCRRGVDECGKFGVGLRAR